MKKKIKKNLLVAGGIVAGIGTIAAEIAMDNYLKKNLPQPKSFGGNSARTFADLGVVFTGYSIAGGLLCAAASIDTSKTSLDSDHSESEYGYDEDFDAADLDDTKDDVDPVDDPLESILKDLEEGYKVSEDEDESVDKDGSKETPEQEVEKTTDDSNVEDDNDDKPESTESEELTESASNKGKKRK